MAALVMERQIQNERYMRATDWRERQAARAALDMIRARLHALGVHGIA